MRKLAIAAVIPGPQGRAMINGRMRYVGDEVAPGIWLQQLEEGRLQFRDAQGNLYPRRF